MRSNVNVDSLTKLYEEDGSRIVDGGQLPYRIQVEHHDVGEASQIRRKKGSVEALPYL